MFFMMSVVVVVPSIHRCLTPSPSRYLNSAGAIWGGAEVVKLRNADNAELWRWLSIGVGVLCFARFVTLNVPYKEDEGDILGPAGPWSLRLSLRLRAVCDHPFHYFVRALPPSTPKKKVD